MMWIVQVMISLLLLSIITSITNGFHTPFIGYRQINQHPVKLPRVGSRWNSFHLKSKQNDDDDNTEQTQEEFIMPSTAKLISDIPANERGIGIGIDLGTTNSAVSILNDKNIPQLIKVNGKSTIPSVVSLCGSTQTFKIGETMDDDDDDDDRENEENFVYRHVKRIIGMGTTSAACSAEVVPHLHIQTASQRRKGLSMNKKNKKEGLGSMKLEHMMKEAQEAPARLRLPMGYEMDVNSLEEETTACEDDSTRDDEGGNETMSTASPEYISSKILKLLFETVEETTGERITRAVIGVPAYFNDMQREATIRVRTAFCLLFDY